MRLRGPLSWWRPACGPRLSLEELRHDSRVRALRTDERPAELEYEFLAFPLQDLELLSFYICGFSTDLTLALVWSARSCRKAFGSQLLPLLYVCAAGCCFPGLVQSIQALDRFSMRQCIQVGAYGTSSSSRLKVLYLEGADPLPDLQIDWDQQGSFMFCSLAEACRGKTCA